MDVGAQEQNTLTATPDGFQCLKSRQPRAHMKPMDNSGTDPSPCPYQNKQSLLL